MSTIDRISSFSTRHPIAVLLATLAVAIIAALGTVRLEIDTDPENMLPSDDPVRVRNAQIEEELGEGPMIIVGVLGEVHRAEALSAIGRVHDGLVAREDVVDDSTVSVASVFDDPPSTEADAAGIVARVQADPILAGNVLFADEPGAAVFVGLTDKGAATEVADAARALIAAEPALAGLETAIGGQPLAEDAFGQEMFVQMAIYAPLAGMFVFGLMLAFFRRLRLVVPAMALAMLTVVITMGALIGSGNTLHIMSSMIPIFLMPIAILDSVHVLSEFYDRYDGTDRGRVLSEVLTELRRPLGFTSLTTAVGFGSLVLVPIPPVRVFGAFVALGVGVAWILTFTLLPALVCLGDDKRLRASSTRARGDAPGWLARIGAGIGRHRRPILAAFAVSAALCGPGLMNIVVNDNPVRWFRADHPVRVATRQLGDALPGTFTANLLARAEDPTTLDDPRTRAAIDELADALRRHPEIGAVQTYVDREHPLLRSDDLANIRLQLRTGDNTAMQQVVDATAAHLAAHPIAGVQLDWAGAAYLNLVWQEKMVEGMMVGFATTLGVIFGLLVVLFRSWAWALLGMVPVVWTVLVVYGAMAFLGRDYDMPVAVLSTMVLGIGVDFAIHFVERYRTLRRRHASSRAALAEFFGEPARAMTRNAVVIAVGFSPLLLSSLVPYVVVGVLLASIVGLSWLSSIVVLPALSVEAASRRPQSAEVLRRRRLRADVAAWPDSRRSRSAPSISWANMRRTHSGATARKRRSTSVKRGTAPSDSASLPSSLTR